MTATKRREDAKRAPSKTLDAKPAVRSQSDIDLALHELGYMKARDDKLDADMELRKQQVVDDYLNQRVVVVDGAEIPFHERREQLIAAIESYCNPHRDELLEGSPKKSVKLEAGEIGWKYSAAGIGYAEGQDKKSVLRTLIEESRLLQKVRQWLERIQLVRTRGAHLFLDVKFDVSLKRIKAAFDDGKIKDEHLDEIGMRFVEGEESFYCKPATYEPDRLGSF